MRIYNTRLLKNTTKQIALRKRHKLSALALMLFVSMIVTACGQPDQSTRRSLAENVTETSTPTPSVTPTNTDEPEPTLEPGFSATKEAVIEREEHQVSNVQATLAADGSIPTPAETPAPTFAAQLTRVSLGLPPNPPQVEATPTLGERDCDLANPDNFLGTTCWVQQYDGAMIFIETGRYFDRDNAQDEPPVLRVHGEGLVRQDYPPPHSVGPLFIESIVWPHVNVTSDPTQQPVTVFGFNLETRVWEDTSSYQTPTPTPFGIAAGPLRVGGSPEDGWVSVSLKGRFNLGFDKDHTWQPYTWYDPMREPNLARSNGGTLNYNVLQSPIELAYDQWYGLEQAISPTLTIQEETDDHVVLATSWEWHAQDASTFTVTATHSISATGEWQVHMTLTNRSSSVRTFTGLEYAFTNVNPQLAWTESLANDSNSFTETRSDGPSRLPMLQVQRIGTQGTFDTDGDGNRYWSVGTMTLQPGATWEVSWNNRIWPGQP